ADLRLGALTVVLVQTVLAAFALAALSLLTSVWTKTTRDAVLLLYALLALGFGAWLFRASGMLPWGWGWLDRAIVVLDPGYVLEPLWKRGSQTLPGWRLLAHVAAWGIVAIGCLALAVWRMRPAYYRQMEGPNPHANSRWSWLRRPP